MGWNKLCIWKKKNDGFWMNRGFEIKRDIVEGRAGVFASDVRLRPTSKKQNQRLK